MAILTLIQVYAYASRYLEVIVEGGMLIMLWAKICLLIEDLRIFGYMREDMAKVPYQLRSYDMQRFEIWVNLEILISVGIMCSCFLYTFVRAFTRNRFVMTIHTANKF